MTTPEALLDEALSLRGCHFEALHHLPPGLRTLRLVSLNAENPEALARFVELEALVVDVLPLTPTLIAVIAGLPRLRALMVCSDRLPLGAWSGGFGALELLWLPHLDVDLAVLERFLRSPPLLRVLRVADAQLAVLPSFVVELTNLRELDLSGVPISDEALGTLRRARPDLVVRTSPVNLGWKPGIKGVLRVPDGFAVDEVPPTGGWISGFEVSLVNRQVTVTSRWQETPADAPDFQEAIAGPFAVEAFIREGPPIELRPWDRSRLRLQLERRLVGAG